MAAFSNSGNECIERNVLVTTSDKLLQLDSNKLDEEFDVEEICNWIEASEYLKVCLQFPDDMLHVSAAVYEAVKSRIQAELYILADTTYSSCCVDEIAAMHVQADAVVHFGHSCLSTCSIPVFKSLPKHPLDMQSHFDELHNYCRDRDTSKLCLFYDAAYYHLKDEISNIWFKLNPAAYVAHVNMAAGEDSVMGRTVTNAKGEVLNKDKFDGFSCVYIGTHSQTLFNCVISINAEWILMDPKIGKIQQVDESAWFKRRRYLIEKCRDAKNVGILVCKLSGQSTKDIIRRMKELCKLSRKKSYIISVGKPNVSKLANFPEIDVYVLIACPENDLYSSRDFYQPLVYPYELEVAVNSNIPYIHNVHIPNFEHLLHQDYSAVDSIQENADMSLITGAIRESKGHNYENNVTTLEKTAWVVESIGDHLSHRTWAGLEQNLGETSVKKVEIGRSGLAISYENAAKNSKIYTIHYCAAKISWRPANM